MPSDARIIHVVKALAFIPALLPALLPAFLPTGASAAPAAFEGEMNRLVQGRFPGGRIVARNDCELGRAKAGVVGLVVQKDPGAAPAGQNPLEAIVVQDVEGKRSLVVLSKEISNSTGSDKDFLADFWDASSKESTRVDIRCVVPGKDPDITPRANGEFKPGFRNKALGRHLCFNASLSYNNWACFNFGSTGMIRSSFVQMNAD